MLKRVLLALNTILMFPLLILLFLLRPFILVRVSGLQSNRIGHFAINTELYLCEKDAGLLPPRTFDVFFHDTPISNHQLKKMWDRKLRVTRLAYFVSKAIDFYPGFSAHQIVTTARDRHAIFNICKPHLSFSDEESDAGKLFLKENNIVNGQFICVLCRDNEYLKKFQPVQDWSYHDYRDVDIATYIPALETLCDRGHYVFRMGVIVNGALESSHPHLMDYAVNGMRSDFLDIYLSSRCFFFISNGTGLDGVAKAFRRPILYTNYIPLAHTHGEGAHDLIIFKKLWMRRERRFMKFSEILSSGVGEFLDGRMYEKHDLEIVNNTMDEIQVAAIEMDARLKGTWETSEEDAALQERFWNLFKPDHMNRVFLSRVGAAFLRENMDLL